MLLTLYKESTKMSLTEIKTSNKGCFHISFACIQDVAEVDRKNQRDGNRHQEEGKSP